MHEHKHRSQNLACTDCRSALEQATAKLYTILEPGQIGDEYATIKKANMCMHTSTEAKIKRVQTVALHWKKQQTSFIPFWNWGI